MEAPKSKGESSHRRSTTFLHKGKSDSLIARWTSLERKLQAESVSGMRYDMPSCSTEAGRSPATSNTWSNRSISRASSTTSGAFSLGIAGALIFPSNQAMALIADHGSKSSPDQELNDSAFSMKNSTITPHLELHQQHVLDPSAENVTIDIMDDHIVSPPSPISLKFVDVTYKVRIDDDQSKWMSCCGRLIKRAVSSCMSRSGRAGAAASAGRKRKLEKKILKGPGVSGEVEAGEVLALMGPSGSGKTTLINLLSGRLTLQNLDQQQQEVACIAYNGMPFSKALKRRMGFVMQDDVLYPHLTVKETLVYAALLRLSKKLCKNQRVQRAMEVIYELGLERCQDTLIGGQFLRGVSGGERKRVCMGQEILIDPSLLFLDEPTSGLDSTTALRIIKLLRKIAQGGRTIVTTIHQPSSRLFHMFDKLILLAQGHLIYYGKASAAMSYFSSIGFSPQLAMNPADFLLDLASGNLTDTSLPSHLLVEQNLLTANTTPTFKGPTSTPTSKIITRYLSKAYCKTAVWAEPGRKTSQAKEEKGTFMAGADLQELRMTEREWSSTWWTQFGVLYMRGLRERRHDYLSWLRVLQVVACALIIGCLWWRSSPQTDRQLVDQVGLLFFIATYWGFFPLFTALFTFPQERAILAKERASDMYRLSAYFMARTLGDIPLDFCLPFAFHIIVYFMAHLRPTASAFFLTLMTILLSTITAQGMGIAIGAIVMDLKKATTLASVTLMTFMLSGGYFVQSIPRFISWIKVISYNYHTFKLLVKVQYNDGQLFDCATPRGCQKVADSTILRSLSLDDGDKEVLVLISMIIGYRLLAYIALRRMRLIV